MTAHTLPSRSSSRAKPKKQLCTRAPRRKFARLMRVLMGKCRLVWKGKHSTKRFFSGAREPNNIGARNTFDVLLVQKHQTRAAIEQWETACIRRERRKYAEQPGMGARHHLAPQRNSRGRTG